MNFPGKSIDELVLEEIDENGEQENGERSDDDEDDDNDDSEDADGKQRLIDLCNH